MRYSPADAHSGRVHQLRSPDDHAYGGQITRLRQRLEGMAGSAIGHTFRIFQDRNDIGWGQHWPPRLEEGLNEVLFLIRS